MCTYYARTKRSQTHDYQLLRKFGLITNCVTLKTHTNTKTNTPGAKETRNNTERKKLKIQRWPYLEAEYMKQNQTHPIHWIQD